MPKTDGSRLQIQIPNVAAVQSRFRQGIALHQEGKLADAEQIYREVIRQQPSHFGALHMLGVLAIHTGRPEQAASLIRRAIGLDASIAAAHSNLGRALLDSNRFQEALASFDEAIRLDPDFAIAHNNRGKALLDLKRPEDAVASFRNALTYKQDYQEAWNNLACALIALCRWKEAEEASKKAISLKADFAGAWTNLGYVLFELDRWEDAMVACHRAIELNPNDIDAWHTLGCTLIALRRWIEAEEACRNAVAIKPDHSGAWINLSRALAGQKRVAEAKDVDRRAFTLVQNNEKPIKSNEANIRKLHESANQLVEGARENGGAFILTVEQIRELHRIVMHDLLPNAGEFRKRSVVMARSAHSPPNWGEIPTLMDDLCCYVNANWTRRDAIHLAAFVSWYVSWIHPFGDGNGRVARALFDVVYYIKNSSSFTSMQFSLNVLVKKDKVYDDYINCLNCADDVYSQTQKFEPAIKPVEQWLGRLLVEHFKKRDAN